MSTEFLIDETTLSTNHLSHICGSSNIFDNRTGELICSKCGLILDKIPVLSSNQKYQQTYGGFFSKFDMGISTDFQIKRMNNQKTYEKFKRLHYLNYKSKIKDNNSRNLNIAFNEIDRIYSSLRLPLNIKEKAAKIYREALVKEINKGCNIDAFSAASVYLACRLNNLAINIRQISLIARSDVFKIAKAYRILKRSNNIKPSLNGPELYIPKTVSRLGLSLLIELNSLKLLEKLKKERITIGKNPNSVAAAIVYYICKQNNMKITQTKIANAAVCSEVTMRKRLKEIKSLFCDKQR